MRHMDSYGCDRTYLTMVKSCLKMLYKERVFKHLKTLSQTWFFHLKVSICMEMVTLAFKTVKMFAWPAVYNGALVRHQTIQVWAIPPVRHRLFDCERSLRLYECLCCFPWCFGWAATIGWGYRGFKVYIQALALDFRPLESIRVIWRR